MKTRDGELETYVAFLRGINVGGNKMIKMAELRKVLEAMGLESVKTLLASGNVLFSSPKEEAGALVHRIEANLEKSFSTKVGVILRTLAQIREIVAAEPFAEIEMNPDLRLYVTFLGEKSKKSTLKIPYESEGKELRILRVSEGEIFSVLDVSAGGRTVDAMGIIEKEFGRKVTTRNWNTVLKVAA